MAVSKVTKKDVETDETSLISFSNDLSSKYQRVLCAGRPKTGKTVFASTYPKPFFFNADHGMLSVSEKNIPFVPIYRANQDSDKKGSRVCTWMGVMELVFSLANKEGALWESLEKAKYIPETIVIDSLSALCDVFEAEIVMWPYDGKARQGLFLSDYNVINQRVFSLISRLREMPYHLVVTATIDYEKDDLGRLVEQPSASGSKLGGRIPQFFDEVYYHSYNSDKKVWQLSPVQTKLFPHSGTRLHIPLQSFDNPSYSSIQRAIKK